MPIEIKHEKKSSYSLGGVRFETEAADCARRIFVHAEAASFEQRPICLTVNAFDHRTGVDLSLDEAEALVAAIQHAVTLRRAADDAAKEKATDDFGFPVGAPTIGEAKRETA